MKKIITLLTAFAMTFTLFSSSLSVMPASAEETQSTIENDISVSGENSFGNLISKEFSAKIDEQQANNGCNIFSAEITGNQAVISFETLRECTLVAAIYDESGTQLLASGSEIVEKDEKEKTVTIDIETMPQYFYFKAFLVDTVTMKPISTVYESPNYTQEMQEFFAKTVEDFDAEKVFNLDDDNTTNFAVFNESTKMLTTDGSSNKLTKSDNEAQQYVFENADETITALKAGDIFAYQCENKEMLIVKIGKINVSGTTVTVTGDDTSLENVFEYVKIETDSDISDAKIDGSKLPEGITYADDVVKVDNSKAAYADMGYMPEKYSINDISSAGFAEGSIKAVIDDFYIGDKDSDNYAKVSGSAELGMDLHFQLYLSWNYQHFELKDNYSVKVALAFEGQVEGSIPLGLVIFTPVPGVIITITPSVVARLNAKIEVSLTMTGTIGFNIDNYTGFTSLCTNPEFDTELKIEGTFFIGLSFKPELDLGGKWIAEASLTAEVGIEVKATLTTDPPQTVSKRHSCKACIDGDVSGKLNFSAEVTFLNSKDLTWGYESDGAELRLGNFYFSLDKLKGGRGECPYCEYLVKVIVEDEHYDRVSGALVSKITDSENYAETDENGEVSCYVPGGEEYNLMAQKANKRGFKSLTINQEGLTAFIFLNITLPSDPIDISFSVADKDGNPVEGAEISNDFTDDTCISDAEGKATMKLPEGFFKFSVKAEGFRNLSEYISVDKDNCDIKITVEEPGQTGLPGNLMGGLAGSIIGGKGRGIVDRVKKISLTDESFGAQGSIGAITENGSLYMWGYNDQGQLGNGTTKNIATPTKIMNNVKDVSIGSHHSAAITEDGSLYMWGYNNQGQLGNGTTENSLTPIKIMDNVKAVSIGSFHSAAITEDGSLYMWGYNNSFQIDNSRTTSFPTPKYIMGNVKSVNLHEESSAAITEDGGLYTWGSNYSCILGEGSIFPFGTTRKKILSNVDSISFGGNNGAAITKDGSLYMWGEARLINGSVAKYSEISTPRKIMDNVTSVSIEGVVRAAIIKDGSLYMWGSVESGNTLIEQAVKIMDNVTSVNSGGANTAAITDDGSLYMWGWNDTGQLGNGKLGYDGKRFYNWTPTKINNAPPTLSTVLNTRRNSLLSEEPAKETGGTKAYSDLIPNTVYNFYSLKTRNTETPLSGENILFVDQYVSDEKGNLNISYHPKEEYADAVTLLTTSAATDISGAKVTVPDIVSSGEEQYAQPTVTLNGVTLLKGIDYDVEKDYSASVPGEYELIIVGTGDYTGKISASYNVICEHNFVDGKCSICGLIETVEFIKGDANGDGKFNIRDAAFIAKAMANGEKIDAAENPAADYNEDGNVNIRDAAAIAKYLSVKTN